MDTLRFQLSGRREFERLKASDPATLTDLERAGRFLYLQRPACGGKVAGCTFGVDPRSGARFNLTRLVTVEDLDWPDFIDCYDRPETLGIGRRLRPGAVRARPVRRAGRAPGEAEEPLHPVDQRRAGDSGNVRRLPGRGGRATSSDTGMSIPGRSPSGTEAEEE